MNNNQIEYNNNFEFFPLEWDTNYFGVNSAKVILKDIIDEKNQHQILKLCRYFEFVTILNNNNINENNLWITYNTKAFLVDINVQFIKNVKETKDIMEDNIYILNYYPKQNEILEVARSSFKYSRFFNDPYLETEKAKNIYSYWVECSFNREDKYFVTIERDKQIAGFLLFSKDKRNKNATIELIAVCEKFRGQSIGKKLVYALEGYCYNNKLSKILVGTQVNNINAVRFYNSCGFLYKNCNSIYHYWVNR